MTSLLILYGTTEGQTRKIAEYLSTAFSQKDVDVTLWDATHLPHDHSPKRFDAVMIAASVHQSLYQHAVDHYVLEHAKALNAKPTAFVSVSMNIASDHEEDIAEAKAYPDRFSLNTGWKPGRVHHCGGALRYTKYDFFKRWIMQRIARSKGEPSDTGHDYEFTDWRALDVFAKDFFRDIEKALKAPS